MRFPGLRSYSGGSQIADYGWFAETEIILETAPPAGSGGGAVSGETYSHRRHIVAAQEKASPRKIGAAIRPYSEKLAMLFGQEAY